MNEHMGNRVDLDEMLRSLGRAIAAWRKRRDMSREDLAELTGLSFKQVGNIERGERGQLAEAWKVAIALDIDFSALVGAAEEDARRAL